MHSCKNSVYLQSHLGKSGVWRSWLAHLVWDQRVLCSSHSTPTKEIKVFDFGLFFMSAHLRAGAVSRTEDASGAAGGCLWHGTPLKMRRVPEKPVFGTEYLFRTVEACFEHRVPLKMRRVPQEAFLSTARIFRTIGGPLRYRMPQTAERRRALPAANATTARKEKPSAKSAARDAAASKKITAKKFAIPPQICSTPPGRVDVAKIHSMPPQSCPMPPESSRLIPEFCNDT